jgi:hypothetical protein
MDPGRTVYEPVTGHALSVSHTRRPSDALHAPPLGCDIAPNYHPGQVGPEGNAGGRPVRAEPGERRRSASLGAAPHRSAPLRSRLPDLERALGEAEPVAVDGELGRLGRVGRGAEGHEERREVLHRGVGVGHSGGTVAEVEE